MNMLAFPALALIYGLVHNIMILKVYRNYGRDAAMMVAVASILLVVGTFVIIFRLLGSGDELVSFANSCVRISGVAAHSPYPKVRFRSAAQFCLGFHQD